MQHASELLRTCLGMILLSSGLAKLVWFRATAHGFPVLSQRARLRAVAAAVLVGAEVSVGVGLVAGAPQIFALGLAAVLFGAFAVYGFYALTTQSSGDQAEVPCACLGGTGDLRVSYTFSALNAGLAGLAAAGAASAATSDWRGGLAYAPLLLGGMLLAGTYWISYYALGVRQRVRESRTGGLQA